MGRFVAHLPRWWLRNVLVVHLPTRLFLDCLGILSLGRICGHCGMESREVQCRLCVPHWTSPHTFNLILLRHSAFLLNNGNMYYVAHMTALAEYLITLYFFPGFKQHLYVSQLGKCARTALAYLWLKVDARYTTGPIGTSHSIACHDSCID